MRTKEKKPLSPERRRLRVFGVLCAACFVGGSLLGYGGFYWASHAGKGALVQSEGNPVGGSFRVASLGGSIVTDGDFRGSWLVVWFVDPRCPKEQCYPALKTLDHLVTRVRNEGHSITPLVVSLDTSAASNTDDLKEYVQSAAPHIMPFYASQNMVEAMTELYHAPLHQEAGYYTPASSFVVMNPHGRYVESISTDIDDETLYQKFHTFMML